MGGHTNPVADVRTSEPPANRAHRPKNPAGCQGDSGLIIEVRKEPTTLRMWRLDEDTTVVTLADKLMQSPKDDSTHSLLTCLGGKAQNQGEPGKLNVVAWRTWRLPKSHLNK